MTVGTKLEQKCVLVVDDNQGNRDLMGLIITSAGHDYHIAQDGYDGLNVARATIPDLILLDIRLPGLSGFEVAEHLKEDPTTQHIPIIFVTAAAGDDPDPRMSLAEATVIKPINVKSIVKLLNEWL